MSTSGVPGRRPSSLERDERWARVAWAFLAEPRETSVVAALGTFGAVEALARFRAGHLLVRPGALERLPLLDVDDLAHAADRQGVHVVVPGDEGWPLGVDRLDEPPYALFVRGYPDLDTLVERSVAVVGSRAATDYGMRTAADLAEGLGARGFTIISGAAYGIDSAAHRAALASGGPTVAVLACGADRFYPAAHRSMLNEIARTGAVVSEVPVGAAPYRSRFLARNRLIATFVVEASQRSGSLTTARHARENHLPVGAVPGPVTSMASAGCHALIRDAEAVLVTDAAEVAELAGRIGEDVLPGFDELTEPRAPQDDLDPVSYAVWSAVPVRSGASTEKIAAAAAVDARSLIGILAALEALGLVRRDAGTWRKVTGRRAAR
jgi:DNA processing protein